MIRILLTAGTVLSIATFTAAKSPPIHIHDQANQPQCADKAAIAQGGCIQLEPIRCGVAPQPVVQLAILLDTSGSMTGLINQARERIWNIVNELSKAKSNGISPRIELALYRYGSDDLAASNGYLECLQPFTSNLDAVSATLFSLTTNGSSEYCGWVIQSATRELAWKPVEPGATVMRVIVIAGNETFEQGPVNFRTAVPGASSKGIVVNTIYCGNDAEGANTGWLYAAHMGGGQYASINQDHVAPQVDCPQDARLSLLNSRLNETYLPYGDDGKAGKTLQSSVDLAVEEQSVDASYSRINAKASAAYRAADWDLVDAVEDDEGLLLKMDEDDLPAELRGLTFEVRLEKIRRMRADRDSVKAEIIALSAEREVYLKDALDELGETGDNLGSVLVETLVEQAKEAGFEFEDAQDVENEDEGDEGTEE